MKPIEPINGAGLSIRKGNKIRYNTPGLECVAIEAVVEDFGYKSGQRILFLNNGFWCYRKQVIWIERKAKR